MLDMCQTCLICGPVVHLDHLVGIANIWSFIFFKASRTFKGMHGMIKHHQQKNFYHTFSTEHQLKYPTLLLVFVSVIGVFMMKTTEKTRKRFELTI